MNETSLEVEVKFLVDDLAHVRHRLIAAGGVVHKPRVYERNIRYDNAWDGLLRKGEILRLRQDSRARVTFKGIPSGVDVSQSEARIREELEIEVSDFDTADLIFKRVGFAARQVYEKYRETLQLGDVEVVLDEMPYGDFVELEGPEATLKDAAQQLGLDWNRRILANYLYLMAQLKAHHDLPFDDLTFANFNGLKASVADIL